MAGSDGGAVGAAGADRYDATAVARLAARLSAVSSWYRITRSRGAHASRSDALACNARSMSGGDPGDDRLIEGLARSPDRGFWEVCAARSAAGNTGNQSRGSAGISTGGAPWLVVKGDPRNWQSPLSGLYQKAYLTPNCMMRGVPA